jgi:hypothetical protein
LTCRPRTNRQSAFIAAVLCLIGPGRALAFGVRGDVMSGVLQQPASQYYHLVRGAAAEVNLWKSWVVRANYLERPEFQAAGFVDQDFISFVDTGCSFFKRDQFDILAYGGFGRAWGYLKRVEPLGDGTVNRNDYSMNVLSVSMELSANLKWIDLRLGHAQHIGQGDKYQTEAKVAWPFSTYYLAVSKFVGTP